MCDFATSRTVAMGSGQSAAANPQTLVATFCVLSASTPIRYQPPNVFPKEAMLCPIFLLSGLADLYST